MMILKKYQLAISFIYSIANVFLYYLSIYLIETNNSIILSMVFPLALFFVISLAKLTNNHYWLIISWVIIIVFAFLVLSVKFGGLASAALLVLTAIFLVLEAFETLIVIRINNNNPGVKNESDDNHEI